MSAVASEKIEKVHRQSQREETRHPRWESPENQAEPTPSDGASNIDTGDNAIGIRGTCRSVLTIVPVRVQSNGKNLIETINCH